MSDYSIVTEDILAKRAVDWFIRFYNKGAYPKDDKHTAIYEALTKMNPVTAKELRTVPWFEDAAMLACEECGELTERALESGLMGREIYICPKCISNINTLLNEESK